MNNSIKWLNRVVFVGVVINIFGMALPFILAPQWYLNWFGLPGGGGSVIWMRQAGLLLFFISILYVPGGAAPRRYNLNAKFAVLVRMTIGLYWFWLVYVDGQSQRLRPAPIRGCPRSRRANSREDRGREHAVRRKLAARANHDFPRMDRGWQTALSDAHVPNTANQK
jgi:hypothetical protein